MTPPDRPADAPRQRDETTAANGLQSRSGAPPSAAHRDPGPQARPPVDSVLRSWRRAFVRPPDGYLAEQHLTSIVAAASVLAHDEDEIVVHALTWRARMGQLMAATTAKIVIGAVAATATTTGLAATGSLPKPVEDVVSAVAHVVTRPVTWMNGWGDRQTVIVDVPPPVMAAPPADGPIEAPVVEGPPPVAPAEPLLALAPKEPTASQSSAPAPAPAAVVCEPNNESSPGPSEEASEEPSAEPTADPTTDASEEPSEGATEEPTPEPTDSESDSEADGKTANGRARGHDRGDDGTLDPEPSEEPTSEPTSDPSADPTDDPSAEPTTEEGTDGEPGAEGSEADCAQEGQESTGADEEPSDEATSEPSPEPTPEPTPEPSPTDEPATMPRRGLEQG